MKGYWRNPKATAEMITPDGWLRTGWVCQHCFSVFKRFNTYKNSKSFLGDLVREDPDHQLFVVSRLKELIKVNAFQVAPTELEELISKLSGVADCAVVGIPDAKTGEVPRAFVVKKPGVDLKGGFLN
jgi:acyl-CoA synthetase (AMP-forming)/AMP-acid ligase II